MIQGSGWGGGARGKGGGDFVLTIGPGFACFVAFFVAGGVQTRGGWQSPLTKGGGGGGGNRCVLLTPALCVPCLE